DGLAEIVAQQDIFGRDRAVGFPLEHPVSVGLPIAEQRLPRGGDPLLRRGDFNGLIAGMHFARRPQFATGFSKTRHALKTKSAARSPDRTDPSIVAGSPVSVQSPARNRFL